MKLLATTKNTQIANRIHHNIAQFTGMSVYVNYMICAITAARAYTIASQTSNDAKRQQYQSVYCDMLVNIENLHREYVRRQLCSVSLRRQIRNKHRKNAKLQRIVSVYDDYKKQKAIVSDIF